VINKHGKRLSDSNEESVPAERKQGSKKAGREEKRREKERNEGNEPQIHVLADNNNNLNTAKKNNNKKSKQAIGEKKTQILI
jgi:hypothetical protein